tara:strand:+ start:2415 stop:3212 length:798 start_codon:yes stop_codon:yes gene_type:complete
MLSESERKKYLSGSDLVRIYNGDELAVWKEKTGREQVEDLTHNLPVQMGIHTEPFNSAWFQYEYMVKVYDSQKHTTLNWEGTPFSGHIDGRIKDTHDIVEFKHTFDRNTMEAVAERYMPQIQLYLYITTSDNCYLSVLFGNRRWESICIKKNWDYIENLRKVGQVFWQSVVNDTPPSLEEEINKSIDTIELDAMVKRDASKDNHFRVLEDTYIKLEGSAKEFDNVKKQLKESVKPNEREVYTDRLAIKRDKRGSLRFSIIDKKEN